MQYGNSVDSSKTEAYQRHLRASRIDDGRANETEILEAHMAVPAIPQGSHSLTAGLTCKNAAQAIELYKRAFGATERNRMASPDGTIMHAELQIGNSMLFVADEYPGMSAAPGPGSLPSQSLYLYVENVDSIFDAAVAAGCQGAMPVADMFWGDRMGKVIDPFGHHWNLATHIEEVAPAEMERRAKEWMAQMAGMAKGAGQS
jgi:PhnB protein